LSPSPFSCDQKASAFAIPFSLSSWFRDYLYIPLGGNRCGKLRTYLNLVAVFFLCGLWHGASWTFVAWGLFHGCSLVLERSRLGRRLERLPGPVQHAYTLFVVMLGWVFIRADTFGRAMSSLTALSGLGQPGPHYALAAYLGNDGVMALGAGLVCSTPVLSLIERVSMGVLVASARRRWLA
jgi:alginate O-acetyltransferase complex protein AlgI